MQNRDTSMSISEARAIQERLRHRVVPTDRFGALARVAGVDASIARARGLVRAAVAVLTYPGLELVESSVAVRRLDFPYVPGYLSFRELPAVLSALESLAAAPDMLLCDGQGLAHPRRLGLASHLGVATDIPSIGVAKSRLIGTHEAVPAERGGWTPLTDPRAGDEIIGAVLRSRPGTRPLFVSIGHRVSLASAVEIVMRCVTRFRLPETTRAADRLAGWR